MTDYVHFSTYHHQERTKINNGDIVTKDCSWDYSNENGIKYTETINGVLSKAVTYDRYGRVTSVESAAGTETRTYTDIADGSYEVFINKPGRNDERHYYDRRGNIIRKTDANNKTTVYSYTPDEKNRSITSGSSTQSYNYIPNGLENAGKVQSVSDNLKTTTYQYYPDGRIKQMNFDGIKTDYEYYVNNGQEEKTVIDNNGKRVFYKSNESGKPLLVTYESDGSEDLYEYDNNGNMTKLTHQKAGSNYSYIYGYDVLNRVTSITYDNETPVTFTYDETGNIRSKTEGGITTEYLYDAYNRLIRTDVNGLVKERLSYADACPSCCGGNSKISSETVENYGVISYGYTAEGWLETTVYSPFNQAQTVIQNEYDNAGNLKKVKLDGKYITEYGYDQINFRQDRVYDLTDTQTGTYEISYDAAGHKTDIIYPNGNKMEYGYGQAYWLTKSNGMLVKKDGTREMITKSEIIQRDGVGNILKKSVNTGEITYTYDNLYQLTGYENEAAGDIAYGYDYRGNRESMNNVGTTTTYDLSNNNKTTSINSATTKTLTYDTRGNLTQKGGIVNVWDYKNRLTSVTVGSSILYKYNNSDRKIHKEYGSYSARKGVFYYYNGDKLICEKNEAGKMMKVYTNDNTGVLGMLRYVYDETGSFKSIQKLYYLFDDLGSVTAITAETGLPVKYYLYDPFGNVTNTKQDEWNMFAFVGRYGGQKDWDTGFTQFQHRWYDSEIGKWLSRDPIGIKDSLNLYQYVKQNPTNYIDVSGLVCCNISGISATFAIGVGAKSYVFYYDCTDGTKGFGSMACSCAGVSADISVNFNIKVCGASRTDIIGPRNLVGGEFSISAGPLSVDVNDPAKQELSITTTGNMRNIKNPLKVGIDISVCYCGIAPGDY